MNQSVKDILNGLGFYHPLQSFYRKIIFSFRRRYYRRKYKQYAGRGFTCNVCGCMYSKFVPDHPLKENRTAIENNHVIAGYGENIICPNCLSVARERLLIAFLKDKTRLAGKKTLQLSPEKNLYHFLKKEKAVITTADLSPGFYKSIDQSVQQQDATRLSFNDNSFDFVIANHIFEHIPDDRAAMREIMRVMKPGAMALLQVPYSEKLFTTIENSAFRDAKRQSALYGQKDHVRLYALDDYLARLRHTGLLVEVWAQPELDPYLKFAIQPREKLFIIHKAEKDLWNGNG